ncbi:MAG: hypothetical protein HQL88_05655 [Magnetococcales bacterium]|nr:hypothetical protein [Magnetococcales bacterium]
MEQTTTGSAYRYLLAVCGVAAIFPLSRLNLEGVVPLIAGILGCALYAGVLLRMSITPSYSSRL